MKYLANDIDIRDRHSKILAWKSIKPFRIHREASLSISNDNSQFDSEPFIKHLPMVGFKSPRLDRVYEIFALRTSKRKTRSDGQLYRVLASGIGISMNRAIGVDSNERKSNKCSNARWILHSRIWMWVNCYRKTFIQTFLNWIVFCKWKQPMLVLQLCFVDLNIFLKKKRK